tara:strand:- start:1740 stop:2198 length:459 start_codon:yes stop_codon:yes gene_type:complete
MAPSIEDILLARAQQKEEERLSPEAAAIIGAGLGSSLGVTGGHVVHKGGNFLNKIKDGLAAGQGLTRNGLEAVTRSPGQILRNSVIPGPRFAGGLVGAILGGALGVGTRELMIQESPEAQYLAKIQMGQELSNSEAMELERLLTTAYNNTIG